MPTEVELLGALVGTWTTEGGHPDLPDAIHGTATFEWLDGQRFLIGCDLSAAYRERAARGLVA